MKPLNWSDIFTDASELPFGDLLALWPQTVGGRLRPIGASAFGDLFFERPEGPVQRLDALQGGIHTVAESVDQFSDNMNSLKWQETNLLTLGVARLIGRGLTRGPQQFYGFAPHPALSGTIDWARAMPLDARVWHSICAQVLDAK